VFQDEKYLKERFPREVQKITSIFACEWKDYKFKHGLELEAFWLSTNLSRSRPLVRLTPRSTLRGGYTELYRLKFTVEENPGWKIYFADVNSLYAHIAMNTSFPTGKYKILLDGLKQNISFQNGKFLYKNESMGGDAAHVTVLAPSDLFRPYLSYRVNDELCFMSLCRKCMVEKQNRPCRHIKDEGRAFSSCYQITDLEKAVSLGYTVLEFHEIHHYETRNVILTDFVKVSIL
jgi:hypothetical protein